MERGPFPFAGKGGMPAPLSLWGEVWLFWAGGGDEDLEGGFVLSAYFVGGDFGAEEATYGMEGGIG